MDTNGSAVLEALADRSRRTIAELLIMGPRSVVAIADALPLSRPAVSQHLKVLLQVGLVQSRPDGTRRIYSLDPQGLEALQRYLQQFWSVSLGSYAEAVQRHQEEQ